MTMTALVSILGSFMAAFAIAITSSLASLSLAQAVEDTAISCSPQVYVGLTLLVSLISHSVTPSYPTLAPATPISLALFVPYIMAVEDLSGLDFIDVLSSFAIEFMFALSVVFIMEKSVSWLHSKFLATTQASYALTFSLLGLSGLAFWCAWHLMSVMDEPMQFLLCIGVFLMTHSIALLGLSRLILLAFNMITNAPVLCISIALQVPFIMTRIRQEALPLDHYIGPSIGFAMVVFGTWSWIRLCVLSVQWLFSNSLATTKRLSKTRSHSKSKKRKSQSKSQPDSEYLDAMEFVLSKTTHVPKSLKQKYVRCHAKEIAQFGRIQARSYLRNPDSVSPSQKPAARKRKVQATVPSIPATLENKTKPKSPRPAAAADPTIDNNSNIIVCTTVSEGDGVDPPPSPYEDAMDLFATRNPGSPFQITIIEKENDTPPPAATCHNIAPIVKKHSRDDVDVLVDATSNKRPRQCYAIKELQALFASKQPEQPVPAKVAPKKKKLLFMPPVRDKKRIRDDADVPVDAPSSKRPRHRYEIKEFQTLFASKQPQPVPAKKVARKKKPLFMPVILEALPSANNNSDLRKTIIATREIAKVLLHMMYIVQKGQLGRKLLDSSHACSAIVVPISPQTIKFACVYPDGTKEVLFVSYEALLRLFTCIARSKTVPVLDFDDIAAISCLTNIEESEEIREGTMSLLNLKQHTDAIIQPAFPVEDDTDAYPVDDDSDFDYDADLDKDLDSDSDDDLDSALDEDLDSDSDDDLDSDSDDDDILRNPNNSTASESSDEEAAFPVAHDSSSDSDDEDLDDPDDPTASDSSDEEVAPAIYPPAHDPLNPPTASDSSDNDEPVHHEPLNPPTASDPSEDEDEAALLFDNDSDDDFDQVDPNPTASDDEDEAAALFDNDSDDDLDHVDPNPAPTTIDDSADTDSSDDDNAQQTHHDEIEEPTPPPTLRRSPRIAAMRARDEEALRRSPRLAKLARVNYKV